VRLVPGIEVGEPPEWAPDVRDFRFCEPAELPAGHTIGWRYTIPVIDMGRYLGYLARRLRLAGGTVRESHIGSFTEIASSARAIVNCTGLDSRNLAGDDLVYPTRGQQLVVSNPGVRRFFQHHGEGEDLTYILPHDNEVVLGGSAVPGAIDLDPDMGTAREIFARCVAVEPLLEKAKVIRHQVGLRPTRPGVRVERDTVRGVPLIHNYGHGDAGVTLSWGCADEVRCLLN